MNRRHSLKLLSTLPLAAPFAARGAEDAQAPLRAAIIGHTGRGNYGHRIEQIFRDRPGVQTVGVADGGDLRAAEKICGLYPGAKPYGDYLAMLEAERPDLVAACPRWTDQHHAMAMSALRAGAHLFIEKPFTRTLAEADELLTLADEHGLKIACAHQMLLDPNVVELTRAIREDDLIGELVEIRVFGKMDHRAGGQDLIVLGTHLFDMVRWFADSEAISCSARVLDEDRAPVDRARTHESAKEDLGPLVGRSIHAVFQMANGIIATYLSDPRMREETGGWGLELVGSKTSARIFLDHPTHTYLRNTVRTGQTIVQTGTLWPPAPDAYPDYKGAECMDAFNRLAADDWLATIGTDRQPTCSGHRAMKSLEMIQSVFWSGFGRAPVTLPLEDRGSPFIG